MLIVVNQPRQEEEKTYDLRELHFRRERSDRTLSQSLFLDFKRELEIRGVEINRNDVSRDKTLEVA